MKLTAILLGALTLLGAAVALPQLPHCTFDLTKGGYICPDIIAPHCVFNREKGEYVCPVTPISQDSGLARKDAQPQFLGCVVDPMKGLFICPRRAETQFPHCEFDLEKGEYVCPETSDARTADSGVMPRDASPQFPSCYFDLEKGEYICPDTGKDDNGDIPVADKTTVKLGNGGRPPRDPRYCWLSPYSKAKKHCPKDQQCISQGGQFYCRRGNFVHDCSNEKREEISEDQGPLFPSPYIERRTVKGTVNNNGSSSESKSIHNNKSPTAKGFRPDWRDPSMCPPTTYFQGKTCSHGAFCVMHMHQLCCVGDGEIRDCSPRKLQSKFKPIVTTETTSMAPASQILSRDLDNADLLPAPDLRKAYDWDPLACLINRYQHGAECYSHEVCVEHLGQYCCLELGGTIHDCLAISATGEGIDIDRKDALPSAPAHESLHEAVNDAVKREVQLLRKEASPLSSPCKLNEKTTEDVCSQEEPIDEDLQVD